MRGEGVKGGGSVKDEKKEKRRGRRKGRKERDKQAWRGQGKKRTGQGLSVPQDTGSCCTIILAETTLSFPFSVLTSA